MGQFADDWNQLKTIIRQKDDALDRQAAQIAALQTQLAALQQQQPDADDQSALAQMHQTVTDNAVAPTAVPVTPAGPLGHTPDSAPVAAVTTFTK